MLAQQGTAANRFKYIVHKKERRSDPLVITLVLPDTEQIFNIIMAANIASGGRPMMSEGDFVTHGKVLVKLSFAQVPWWLFQPSDSAILRSMASTEFLLRLIYTS